MNRAQHPDPCLGTPDADQLTSELSPYFARLRGRGTSGKSCDQFRWHRQPQGMSKTRAESREFQTLKRQRELELGERF